MTLDRQSSFRQTVGQWILLAAWFGLVTGLVEILILLIRRFALGQMIWTSMDLIWLAPIVYVGFFMFPAFLLLVVWRIFPPAVTPARAVLLLGFLSASIVELGLFGGKVHPIAQAMIAAGVAAQLGRWAGKTGGGIPRVVRRSFVGLLAFVALSATVVPGVRHLLARYAESSRPDPKPGLPNILLIIWDTVRAEDLSLYGYSRATTPNLERIGREGVVFERALSTAPWTLSSHGSIFTGRLTQELSTTWRNPLDDTHPTIAEVLSRQGYRSGGFVANLIATTRESGLDRGFGYYEDHRFSIASIIRSTTIGQRVHRLRPFNRGPLRTYPFKSAAGISDRFLRWVDKDPGRPFFAFLNYFDAHDPYFPPREWRRRFAVPGADRNERRRAAYDAAIGYLDDDLDRLLRELDQRGILDNTLLILTSDHGELFGEHGLEQHGNSLYLPLLHVPLVIRLPGKVPAETRVTTAAGLANLPATMISLSGATGDSLFPGVSLETAWQQGDAYSDTLIAGVPKGIGTPPHEPVTLGDMNSVFAGSHHYILNGDGSEQLFDVAADPKQLTNLVGDSLSSLVLPSFRDALRSRVPGRWIHAMDRGQ